MKKFKVIFSMEVEVERAADGEQAVALAAVELNAKISQGEFFVSEMDAEAVRVDKV